MINNNELQKKIKEGINLIEKNNFLEAEKIFKKFLNNKETESTGLLLLGIINIKKKEYLKAKELLYKVLAINKLHPEANPLFSQYITFIANSFLSNIFLNSSKLLPEFSTKIISISFLLSIDKSL